MATSLFTNGSYTGDGYKASHTINGTSVKVPWTEAYEQTNPVLKRVLGVMQKFITTHGADYDLITSGTPVIDSGDQFYGRKRSSTEYSFVMKEENEIAVENTSRTGLHISIDPNSGQMSIRTLKQTRADTYWDPAGHRLDIGEIFEDLEKKNSLTAVVKLDSTKLSSQEAKDFYKDVITLITSDAEGLAQGTNDTDDINHDVANGLKEVLTKQMDILLTQIQDARTPLKQKAALEQFKAGLDNLRGLDYTVISEIAAKGNNNNLVTAFLKAREADLKKAQQLSSAPEKLKAIEAIFTDLRNSVPVDQETSDLALANGNILSNDDFRNQYIAEYKKALQASGIEVDPSSYIRSGSQIDAFSTTEQKEFMETHDKEPAATASNAPAQAVVINGEDFSVKLDSLRDKAIGLLDAKTVNAYIKAIKATLGDENVSKALKSDKSSEYKASRIANAISTNMSLMQEDVTSFRIVTSDNNTKIIQAILDKFN